MKTYLSIDIGTTSTKCFLFDQSELLFSSQCETKLIHSEFDGWVEQDPEELFESALKCLTEIGNFISAKKLEIPLKCGITNQRETTVAFRKSTRSSLCNAISWMDVRTSKLVEKLKQDSENCAKFQAINGLKASTFFSVFKMKWMLENIDEVRLAAFSNDLGFATIDSWILLKLTSGISFFTDPSNASRTFLLDIEKRKWSDDLLHYFGINPQWLPEIRNSNFGSISNEFPLSGVEVAALIGDQQSSLIGHWGKDFIGKSKCTFGTGAFLIVSKCHLDSTRNNYLRTIVLNDHYAEEYPIVCAGSLIRWLKTNLNLFDDLDFLNQISLQPKSAEYSVFFIPDLAGCLFPSWNPNARGSFFNLSLQNDKYDLITAVLESIAFCVRRALSGEQISMLSVDGGMCSNKTFCQLLADVCGLSIKNLNNTNATGFGVALLASDFDISLDLNGEIIEPNPSLKIIYDQKYDIWISFQSK